MSIKLTVQIETVVDDDQYINDLSDSIKECFENIKDSTFNSFSFLLKTERMPMKVEDIAL